MANEKSMPGKGLRGQAVRGGGRSGGRVWRKQRHAAHSGLAGAVKLGLALTYSRWRQSEHFFAGHPIITLSCCVFILPSSIPIVHLCNRRAPVTIPHRKRGETLFEEDGRM